jgi:two-component system, chemotaxis family, CheB/CheR fusion protein
MSELNLKDFVANLAAERELDLRGYKHTTLERRLRKRMAQIGIKDYSEYLQRLREDTAEKNHLLHTVLINVTEFFRDPQAWEVVANNIIPHILRQKHAGEPFRAWVAGCATGEEVFTLAIIVAEYLGDRLPEFDIKIYATDVDDNALKIARRGEYPHERLRRLPEALQTKYFSGVKTLRINREIRRMIIFGKSDLVHDAPISHVDLLLCRNVLIYFDPSTQQQILTRFHYALEEGGILFLGRAESKLSDSTLFKPIHHRWRMFGKLGSAEDTRTLRLQEDLNFGRFHPSKSPFAPDADLSKRHP